MTLSDVPLKGRGGFFLAALCLDRNDVHPMLQKEIDLPVFVRIVSWFHCKLSSELLQDIVFRERPLELVISLQKNCAVVNARHVLEQAGIKQEELELIQLVKGGEGMLHFGDVVDAVQHSRRDQPLNRLLPKRHESRGWRHCQGTESNHRRASGMSGKYDDIIHLPHPTSKKHPRMSIRDRAAIFSPFAALSGHGAAIAETARLTDRRMELDQRQAVLLEHIEEQPEVSVTWFRPDERKDGGAYVTVTGRLKKIDEVGRILILLNGTSVPLDDVVRIESECFQGPF